MINNPISARFNSALYFDEMILRCSCELAANFSLWVSCVLLNGKDSTILMLRIFSKVETLLCPAEERNEK